jgi:hypothetical protein
MAVELMPSHFISRGDRKKDVYSWIARVDKIRKDFGLLPRVRIDIAEPLGANAKPMPGRLAKTALSREVRWPPAGTDPAIF